MDEALLDRRVVAFSRDLHPDLAGAAPGVRARAVLGAAQVNEAFGVLRDAHKRAEYLLTLLGGAGPNQDKSVPAGFLEAMLDERDAVDAAIAQGGAAAEALRARFEARRLEAEAALARGFAALETAIPEERTTLLASLRRELNGMAYYRTLARDLRDGLRDKESA